MQHMLGKENGHWCIWSRPSKAFWYDQKWIVNRAGGAVVLGESTSGQARDFTRWPIRAIAVCATGMGIGFGLCSVGMVIDRWFDSKGLGAGMFLLFLVGLVISLVWLIVAIVISAILSHRDEKREMRENS